MSHMHIVIIGGGMGGLTCGLFLLRNGHTVTLYEQAPEILPVGAAISLWSNGAKVMNSLGLGRKIQDMGGRMNRMVYCGPDNEKPYMSLTLDNVYQTVGERCYPVPRAELQQMLMDEYVKEGGILHLGLRCVDVKHNVHGKAIAVFDNSTESVPADLLIGADGIKSKVRDYVLKGSTENSEIVYHYTNWNGLVPITSDILPCDDEWRMWVAEGKRASVMPVSGKNGKQFYFFMGAPLPVDAPVPSKSERRAELLKLFGNFPDNVKNLISHIDIDRMNRIPICDLTPINKYFKGNVVLIGDAAHGTTPTLGQGGCQAMEDGEVLAWFLQTTNVGIESALARYSAARKNRVHDMVNKARSRTATIYPKNAATMKDTVAWYGDLQKPQTRTNIEEGLIKNMLGGPFPQARL